MKLYRVATDGSRFEVETDGDPYLCGRYYTSKTKAKAAFIKASKCGINRAMNALERHNNAMQLASKLAVPANEPTPKRRVTRRERWPSWLEYEEPW